MGQAVLNTTSDSRNVRVYTHCAVGGGIAVAFLNLATEATEVSFDGEMGSKHEEFFLQAGEKMPGAANPLQSRDVTLNGKLLKVLNGAMPDVTGRTVEGTKVTMPPTSYGF